MSGIYGYIKNESFREATIPRPDRLSMWNKAYGKDAHLEEQEETYLLGCYIEKLSSKAVCPSELIRRDKKRWMMDAVLYNRDEIYELLGDVKAPELVKKSDEELLVELIERKGLDALAEVNGDFAGAVYDTETNSLTLFRDHMGIRPLYYYVSDEFVCFSTDLRGVLSVENVKVTINEEWVYRSYFHLIPYTSTSTEYKYIYCVRPASYLKIEFREKSCRNRYPGRILHAKEYDYEVDDRQRVYWKTLNRVRISEKKYWHLGERKIRYKSEEEYCSELRELIEDSVQRRLNAFDGIAGAEFSGGLDSSLISILIKRLGRECIYCSWSNDPKDYPLVEEDERRTILEICERYSMKCKFLSKDIYFNKFTEFNKRSADVLDVTSDESVLEKYALWPMINTQHLLNSAAYIGKNGAKVVFTGHGGDEGVSHRPNPYELIYHKEIKNYLNYYCDVRKNRNFRTLRGIRRALRAYVQSKKALRHRKEELMAARNYDKKFWQIIHPDFVERGKKMKDIPFTFGYDVVKYILRNGSRNRMDCVAVYGAYCGVRYMFPYLDYRVIDFAVSIERGMYLRHGTNRYVLKAAFRDLLPDSLLGEVNKFDPSFAAEQVEPVPLERKIEVVRKRITEFKERYHCSTVEEIFSLDDILEEIDTKEITEQNIGELIKKCETVLDTFRLQVLVEKARQQ
ncbi:MAG: hypothetical protein IKT67_12765 [Lachnospiraceae bacterium]|nr:hypothetical protein [Lachnospiraceae bacterium]